MDGAEVLLLPLAAATYAALFLRRSGDLLDALLKASLFFVWTAFALSEALGAFHLLSRGPLACGWCAATVLGWALLLREKPRAAVPRPKADSVTVACLAAAALTALVTLCLALRLPPWNIDALLYHLPRVEQWVQNRGLALFPASYDLQDFFPPGSEILVLQARLLAGSQALANLVQWAAFALTGVTVAATVRALGGGVRAQSLGVLAWAALPMAVLQSSNAQNDLCAAFGAALTACFALRHDREPDQNWDLWAAAAAGAALLLKGTNYLFVPAFGLWAALRRDWGRPQLVRLLLLAGLVAAPNLPYWLRNLGLCGSPLGSSSAHFLRDPSPLSLFSNAVKALGDELRCPALQANAAVTAAVARVHAWAGAPLNNPNWTFSVQTPYGAYAQLCAEWNGDYAGAPLQTLALLALAAAILARPRRWNLRYLAACLCGAFLYLGLVRWNVWDTRLHLPWFALACAPLGLGLDRLPKRPLLWCAVLLLGAQGLWAACDNATRPLFLLTHSYQHMEESYPGFFPGYEAALRGTSIGLLTPARCCPEYGTYEYGVLAGRPKRGDPGPIPAPSRQPGHVRAAGPGPLERLQAGRHRRGRLRLQEPPAAVGRAPLVPPRHRPDLERLRTRAGPGRDRQAESLRSGQGEPTLNMAPMEALLLPLTAAAYAALFWRRSGDALAAPLKASLLFVWTAFALTEGLSAFGRLTPGALAVGWALAAGWGFGMAVKTPGPRLRPSRPKPDPFVAACLSAAALIALVTLCLSLGLPQWNLDTQLYHLPRVEQWVQNRTVAPFPTPYDLQDFFPPGSEYLILQFRMLAGSEAFSGLVQWWAFVLAACACAGTVRALDGGARAQALSVLAWAALPMALLQSSTAQNDVVAAYGAVVTAAFAVRHDRHPDAGWDLWAAAAAGAALLLKGTDYLFIPAFGLWIALRRDWSKPQAARLALLLALAALPSLPFWLRNFGLCGSPLGSSSMHFLGNPGPAATLSNALKTLGDELRFPSQSLNARVLSAVSRVHAWLGLPLNNPGWVLFSHDPYGDPHGAAFRAYWHEDYSGAPLQVLALLMLGAAALRRPSSWKGRGAYLAAVLGGALLYCSLVRWNRSDVRLILPLLGLAVAPLAIGLARTRRPALLWAVAILFSAQGLWAACGDKGHPLGLLFSPHDARATQAAVVPGIVPGLQAALHGRSIGLLEPERCCPEDGACEYGLWLGARESGRPFRIQHLLAGPATAPLLVRPPWNCFKPDVLVAETGDFRTRELIFGGKRWLRLGSDEVWAVYLPVPSASASASAR